MKMAQTACSLLTIGPGLTKDKMMQGAGRCRLLGFGQTLVILGTDEIWTSIDPKLIVSSSGNIPLLLKWLIENSVSSIKNGLLTWVKKGISHKKVLSIAYHRNFSLKTKCGACRICTPIP